VTEHQHVCDCTPHEIYHDAQGNDDPAFLRGLEEVRQYRQHQDFLAWKYEADLAKWRNEYGKSRQCCGCGSTDAPHDWYYLPSGIHDSMCEPCYAAAMKARREAEARGVDF
jgi:hypothetical protein